jgi:DNA-binding response OmpR family regulator
MTIKRRILLVEDEAAIREVARLHLELAGFHVTEVGDGYRALDIGRTTRFDLIALDLMLPGIDGVTLCRALRAGGANTESAILMLTARDTESDKVLGLDSGADDYMTKPFGTRELVARAAALLRAQDRRTPDSLDATRCIERSGVTLNLDKRHATIRGRAVEFTKQEFDLLHLLVTHPGVVFSRDALIEKVWRGDTKVTDRTGTPWSAACARRSKSTRRIPN